jgi:hypothetical protein
MGFIRAVIAKGASIIARKKQNQKNHAKKTDRISELPDLVIYHILLLLPTIDVFKMNLLSKNWRRVWASFPLVLNFRPELAFGIENHNQLKLMQFVEYVLSRIQIARLNTFRLMINYNYFGDNASIDRCLSFVAESNVEELDLVLSYYPLPQTILHAKSLRVLKLVMLGLKAFGSITLPSLKTLSLKFVKLDNETIYNLISSCPSLEDLDLDRCLGLSNLRVSNPNLKSLQLRNFCPLQIEIEAMNLQSFVYRGNYGECKIQFVACEALRNLSLSETVFTEYWLRDEISKLPRLKNLKARSCGIPEKFFYL